MLPVLGARVAHGERLAVDSRFLRPDAAFTPSGSAAILCALQAAGVGAGDEVLVPAYHCPTMIWPVQLCGAVPVLVPVGDDLSVALAHLRACCSARTRAVLVPHFFGVLQPQFGDIRHWCDQTGLTLIEDCAHMFYGAAGSDLPGSGGHFAIASTRKFFPGVEGGALVANGRRLELRLPGPAFVDEARCALGTFQLAREYRSLPWQRPAPSLIGATLEGARDEAGAIAEAVPTPSSRSELDSSVARREACRVTRWLVRREPGAISAGIRRVRWKRWREAVAAAPGVSAFVDDLPANAVPYVFAARLQDPYRVFPRLKYAGVQVWRWDRLAMSGCATSRRLGLELIQLPCQQSLDDQSFERLVAAFVAVLEKA